MADPAPQQQEAQPAHDSQPKHDLHAYHDTHHAGIDQLIALSHNGTHRPPPERVAELIELHPRDKDKILEFLHKHHAFGNAYVQQVLADHRLEHRADLVDESLGKHNKHNQGTHGSNGADPNRLETKGHVEATLAFATAVYRNDGTAYADGHEAAAGATVQINAGNVREMSAGGGPKEKHVMAFHQSVGVGGGVTGWVPVSKLDATGKKLAGVDAKLEKEIDHDHKKAGATKFSHTARTVQMVAPPLTMKNLRTAPNQDPLGGANEPEHYFARPGGVVNLLDNAPTSGEGKRYGVAIDVLAPGSKFYAAEPHLHEHTQLWESGSKTLTDKSITFIYGKAEAAGGGEPSYGWINLACLA